MKTLFVIYAVLASTLSFAQTGGDVGNTLRGQPLIQVDRDWQPVCYRGSPKAALKELTGTDYDPAFSHGKILKANTPNPVLYAEQWDENDVLSRTIYLERCKK